MNSKKLNVKYLFKVFVLAVGISLGSFGLTNAQDNKNAQDGKNAQDNKQSAAKVSPDEAKAAKKIEAGKTLAEKVTATKEFITKYPQSSLRNQVAGYLANQI